MNYKYTSRSEEDTLEIAENIESEKFPGMVICLNGELGSGKTVFVKGFANALEVSLDDLVYDSLEKTQHILIIERG